MNGVRVLTVKSAASGDRVQRSFLSDRSLSKHSSEHFPLIYLLLLLLDLLINRQDVVFDE